MEIVRLRRGDEDRLREIRLRALAEAPHAFASNLAKEEAFGDEVWTSRVTDELAANFLAVDGGPVGTAAVIPEDRPGVAHLVGMWVAPEARGAGVARLLIDAVVRWARDHDLRHLELWVADGNDVARALYEKAGFADTGHRQPFPSNPAVMETRLTMVL